MPTWNLLFCAGYIIQPCRGFDPESVRDLIEGSDVDVTTIPQNFFLPLFVNSVERCPIDVVFEPENEKQENTVRSLVRLVAFDDYSKKVEAAQMLACRLACATTKRSPSGLFIVLSGQLDEVVRVLFWKFPADESLQAGIAASKISIRLLQDVFSRSSDYFKAAMFEGNQSNSSFWKGKVEDRQAKQRATEVADFWVTAFLSARPELTDVRGTKLLAHGLRETIKQTASIEAKEALVVVPDLIKTQTDKYFSLNEIVENYLPEEARQAFVKNVVHPSIAGIPFKVDPITLEREMKYKTITINNDFIIKGPLEQFNDVVTIRETNQSSVVEVILRGTITSQTFQSR